MPRLKLTLEYDGTAYVGWQWQANGPSLQEAVEKALEEFLGAKTDLLAAGRTDAGVHAAGQVVSFLTDKSLPMKAYWRGLNGVLPPDISVVVAEEVADGFDPRRHASGKTYRYLVSNRPVRSALRRNTHWELYAPLNVADMRAASRCLIGRHDFSAFRASDCQARHAVRELRRVEVEAGAADEIVFTVEGTAFLKHMVRNIVGSLVEVGKGKESPKWLEDVFLGKDRTRAGPTAPAHGLTLMEVSYVGRAQKEDDDDVG